MVFKSIILKLRKFEKIILSYLAYESLVYSLLHSFQKNFMLMQLVFVLLLGFLFL